MINVFTDVAAIVFILVCYPLISVLIGVYVFFFLSCCFGSKISYLKVEK
ncbi:hypothetical protein LL033_24405 (plasmid) [Clostridium estertheticum]|nr:hypothetical protein [Clostridium estertheticum]MBU3217748.1 hypothetical protein [Clostridium estertheticum]WAG58276.1 hypothetical protein LL033_24405 [Clostridium estertheticum]